MSCAILITFNDATCEKETRLGIQRSLLHLSCAVIDISAERVG